MSNSVIGVDLGGTKIAAVLYDDSTGSILDQRQRDTDAKRGFPAVFDDLLALIQELRRNDTVAVGIGVPGLVRKDGSICLLPNIPQSHDVPFLSKMHKVLEIPVCVDNDSRCFALAEALEGAGKGGSVVVGITMGTGVGGGIVIDGTLLRGSHGFAGEIGHMLLQPGNPPFATEDRRGDVEQFLSGTAFHSRCPQARTPKEYLEGDQCASMHADVQREVAWLCASLTHLVDPDIIVFGGGAGRCLAHHLPLITQQLSQWVLSETPLPDLRIAALEDAGTRGAALLCKTP